MSEAFVTELMKIEDTAPVSKPVWLISSVCAALADNYLLLFLTSKTGNFAIVALFSIVASYACAILGDKLRRFSMPAAYYTHGMLDCMEKKLFWKIGPQLIGIMSGQVVAWGAFFFFF
jgi:hypothetical protein